MAEVLVELNSLSAKQLAKEFKLTTKEIKSKDLSIRQIALKKFEDTRYLLEGGCIVPFIETIVSKKKTIEYVKVALESFLNYVENKEKLPQPSISALDTILTLSGSLDVLENIASLMFYKEDVKKVKGKPVIVSETDLEASLRHLSCQIIINIINEISISNETDSESNLKLCRLFAAIPNLTSYLCLYINNIPKRLEDENRKDVTLIEGVWILKILNLIKRNKKINK